MSKEALGVTIQLATAAFGLVAALAWNTAIQSLFAAVFGPSGGLAGQFAYAIIVTVIVVLVTVRLGKIAERAGVNDDKEK